MVSLLSSAQFRDDFAEGQVLRESADACLGYIEERCWVLDDLCAVQGPSAAITAAVAQVKGDIDRHLAELSNALDAVATFAAVGTREAAQALGEKTTMLAELAAVRPETLALPASEAEDARPRLIAGGVAK